MEKISFLYKFWLLIPTFFITLEIYAATLTIYNKSNQSITVKSIEWETGPDFRSRSFKTSKTFTLKPNDSKYYNSGLNHIVAIEWHYADNPERAWSAGIDMPSASIFGKLKIKNDGQFDSSRLGDNQQAQRHER